MNTTQRQVAEAVRTACIEAALAGYEQAAMSGLCAEGAWEAAVGAMRMLDLEAVLRPGDQNDAAETQTGV